MLQRRLCGELIEPFPEIEGFKIVNIVNHLKPLRLIKLFAISLAITIIIHPGLWFAFANGYPDDYLFNLSSLEIVGLIIITSVMVLLLFVACTASSYLLSKWASKYLARWQLVLSCICLALLLCAIALAIVPQFHYLYYRTIIPDLPAQWVPLGDLSLDTFRRYFLLRADDNTTFHAKGVAVWVCVIGSGLVGFDQRIIISATNETKPPLP